MQTHVKKPLHRALQEKMWTHVPEPTFWIGPKKVLLMEEWKVTTGTENTFAIRKYWDKCYTVVQASDLYIVDESKRQERKFVRSRVHENTIVPRTW